MNTDIFGGLFDFDLNGKTDEFELALGLCMIDEEEKRSRRAMESHLDVDDDDDLDDLLGFDDLDDI